MFTLYAVLWDLFDVTGLWEGRVQVLLGMPFVRLALHSVF